MPKVGDAFVEVHADLGQFKRELQAAGRGVSREIDVKADTSSLKGFNAELSKTSKSMTTTSKDADRAGSSISNFTKRVVTANQGLDLLGKGTALIKWPALISGASYAAQAVNNLAAGATALTGALTPLAGLAAAAPALYGALGQAAGVVALSGVSDLGEAVGGLNEKMDETDEAFKQLSPQAQKLAQTLNQLKGPIRDIQESVQEPLFEGMNRGIDDAMKTLPEFGRVMVATSREMGRLAEAAGRFVGREGFGRDFEEVGRNNAELLGRLGTAGLHLADAFRHVMVEAQPLVDFLGRAAVNLAKMVEGEARAARESGALRSFFRETRDLLTVIGPLLVDFGAGLWNVIRVGKPLGDDILGVLADSAREFREWTESASGRNAIVQWFNEARNPLEQTAKLVRDIGRLFFEIGGGGGLANLIRSLRQELLPVLGDVLKSGRGFGPVFKDFVIEFGKALKPFLGASGPLTLFLKSLTSVLRVFNKIIDTVPELGTVLAQVLGGLSVMRLLGLSPKAGSTMGKTFGKALGRGLLIGWLLALPTIAVELHDWVRARRETIINAGIDIGEFIVNGMIDAVNIGIRSINEAFDALNVLGKFGVDAPEIGEIGHVDWGPFREDMKEGERIVAATTKGMKDKFGDLRNSAKNQSAGAADAMRDNFLRGGQAAGRHVQDFGQKTSRTFRRTRDEVGQSTQGIARSTDKDMGKAEQSAERHGKGAGKGISQPYKEASQVTYHSLKSIEGNTNAALSELKQKPIKFAIQSGKKSVPGESGSAGLQRGGTLIGGRGTGDIVPAMLEPGEVVLNRKAVRALGGAGRANRINKRFPRFQRGGIPGFQEGGGLDFALGPYDVPPIQFDDEHDPPNSHVHITGTSTPWVVGIGKKLQQMGFDVSEHPAFGGVTATHSATGGHYDALAIDVNKGINETRGDVAAVARILGGAGVSGAIAEKIARVLISGPNHVAKNIAQGTTEMVRSGANKFLSKFAPTNVAPTGGGALSPAEFLRIANQAIQLTRPESAGFSAQGLLTLAIAESSLNPNSINNWDSNAAAGNPSGGLMHTTESTFRAYHEPGTANTYFDPLASVAASINYQDATYGGQVTHSPYQRGGIVQKLQGGGAVKGHGGESPSTPLFDWFRVMFDQPLVDSMKGIVGKIGINPSRFENMAAAYSGVGGALDMDELGTVAMAFDTDDPITGETIYGIARGRTAVGGLGSDIGSGWLDLELGQLVLIRDRILTAIPIVDALTKFVKGKIDALTKPGRNSYQWIAEDIYKKAKDAYDELQEKIGNLRTQIKKLEGISKPTDEQKQRLTDLKGRLNGLVNALGVAKQIMTDSKFRVGAVSDVAGAFAARATALDAVKVALKTDGAEDGSWPSLEELQGRTGEAGSIFDTKLEITEALRAAGEAAAAAALDTAGGTEPSELETISADLERQRADDERALRLVAEAQTPIFQQFYGRTFHTGGIIGGSGDQTVTARGGEGIFTEEQMAAMGGANVAVIVEDGAVDKNKIRVVVNDELSSVAARATRVGGTKGQKAVYR